MKHVEVKVAEGGEEEGQEAGEQSGYVERFMVDVDRKGGEVVASEREEEQLDVSLQQEQDDDAPEGKLSEEDGDSIVREESEDVAIGEESEKDKGDVEQEVLHVCLEEPLPILLVGSEGRNAIVGFVVDEFLEMVEVKAKILLANAIADDLESIVNGVVDFLEDKLHVGPIVSLVVDVEKEVVEVAEQLEEETQELAMARHSDGLVDGDEGCLADAQGEVRHGLGLRIRGWKHHAELTFVEIVVGLAGEAVDLPTGKAANTTIDAHSLVYIIELRSVTKGLYLIVGEIRVVEDNKVAASSIDLQFDGIDDSSGERSRVEIGETDDYQF